MKPSLVTIVLASCLVVTCEISIAQDKDITDQMPQIKKGQMVNPLPKPAQVSSPVQMSSDGSKGSIPITKDISLYGQKDPTAKPGETKIQGGVEIKTN